MASITQTINVLQSMTLTDKGHILLTPTYHVIHLHKAHQDAKLFPTEVNTTLPPKSGVLLARE